MKSLNWDSPYIKQKKPILFPQKSYTADEMTQFQRDAFTWAAKEQANFCPQAHKGAMRRAGFESAAMKIGLHESFFCDPDNPNLVLLRMWWEKSHKLSYTIITNGSELRQQCTSLFDQMIRNGLYAYLKEEQPLVCTAIFGKDRE